MKTNFIMCAAAAALLSGAVVMPVNAAETENLTEEAGMLMPTPKKKTTKKKTTKKTTAKKTTAKKTTTAKTTTTTTSKATTTDNENNGGSTLGSVLGGVLGAATGSSNGSGLLSALTTIFDNSKVATADKLVGTWEYTEPAVVFESNNALKNLGGKVAGAAIEKKLQSQLAKFGIKKGKMKMTFDKDGNFTQTIGTQKFTGTYTTSGKNVVLTYAGGLKQLVGTTQLDGNSLLIVMEAGKLLKYAGTIGKLTGNSTVSTLGSLLGGYDGMEVGMRLQK
ncbi:MAG: DUF4923 family protein [Prevotella sp.]|nr:DUF4923 family protein [Prevotella sp.]